MATQSKQGGWFGKLLLLVILASGFYAAYIVFWKPSQSQEVNLETVPVERLDIPLVLIASGSVQPERSVTISPRQPGIVAAILVAEGDKVAAGQVIAQMDPADLDGRLTQAKGQLAAAQASLQRLKAGNRPEEIAQAQARLETAQVTLRQTEDFLARDQNLYAEGAIPLQRLTLSQAERDRAVAAVTQAEQALALARAGARKEDIAQAEAQVLSARGAIQSIESFRKDLEIRAPFAGTITRLNAQPGEFITTTSVQVGSSAGSSSVSSTLATLAGPSRIIVNVAESDIRKIRIGQEATIQADAYPEVQFLGKVTRIAPQALIQQNVVSFEVGLSVEDPAERLKPGMSVEVEFSVGTLKDVLVVPTVSILRQGNETGVFVVGPENTPVFKPIEIGESLDEKTEARAGLQGNEQVFISLPEGFDLKKDSFFKL
jgi:HlyD family secretion protein